VAFILYYHVHCTVAGCETEGENILIKKGIL
jgi:hypothetical protein